MSKLNLGCGHDYKIGWVNLDLGEKDVYGNKIKADIIHDLNKFPYPLKKDEFDEILSYGLIEHIQNLEKHVKELSRISKIGCRLHVHVPYFLSYFAASELYTHKFSLNSTQLFNIFKKNGWKLISKKFNVGRRFKWLNPLANSFQQIWERFPLIIPEGIDWEFIKVQDIKFK